MLKLKEINNEDYEKEYEAISSIPEVENGFMNDYANVTKEEFVDKVIPCLINESKGINLKKGYVPSTYYFLWNDNQIIGLFKIRHRLNDKLKGDCGHIGYGILKEYRGKGYATKGLALAIEIAKNIVKENELYLSCNINNIASLKVQQANGAYIYHSDNEKYLTKIRIR